MSVADLHQSYDGSNIGLLNSLSGAKWLIGQVGKRVALQGWRSNSKKTVITGNKWKTVCFFFTYYSSQSINRCLFQYVQGIELKCRLFIQ